MLWMGAGIAFWSYAGALSVAARRDWPPLGRKPVQYLAILGFFGSYFLMTWLMHSDAGAPAVIFAVPVLLVGMGLAYRFITFLIGDWFETVHRVATGLDRMRVPKTYDLAEKAEREQDLETAIRLYREEGGRDVADPEPWRRIGEIEVRRGRAEEAAPAFRRALIGLREPEARVTTSFRLADILGRLGRNEEARGVVEGVVREFQGTRFEDFAKERLKILAAPVDKTLG